jgi:hypothetical protein
MTSVAPPTEFFPGIDFNPSFYNLGQSAVTLDYLNSNFLRSTGYAISRAQFTLFNGTVDINENLDVSGNINASAYLLNGVPFTPSQWTTSVNDIYYTTGNVGIGKTNPSATYKLDVSGNVNCNAIFTNGTQLTQYTDTNVRTVLSTSVGTGLQWNSSTNRMNVVFPPSPLPYGDTEVRILLSNSAGTNMTWNTGTNRFNVGIATTTSLGVVQVGSGLSITPQGLLSANANVVGIATTAALGTVQIGSGLSITPQGLLSATTYTLPIATNTTLGGVRVDASTIVINATTGVISSVQTQADWNNTDGTSRAFIVNKPTIINSRWSQTGSNIFYNSGNVGIGTTNPTSRLHITTPDLPTPFDLLDFRNTGNFGIYATSVSIGSRGNTLDFLARDFNNNAGITTRNVLSLRPEGSVFIGASTNSSDDGNVNIAIPDSTFYVRGPRVAGSTTNISFRGGLEGNGSGKVRLWLTADAAHSSYIESIHVGNGDTNLIFGTSLGNSLPIERMRIRNNGNTNLTR